MSSQAMSAVVISPMGIGAILDAGFTLTRRNYARLLVLSAWGFVSAAALGAVASAIGAVLGTEGSPSNAIMGGLLLLVLQLAALVCQVLAFGAVTLACARLIDRVGDDGASLDTGALYNAALGRLGALLLYGVVLVLLAIPLVILFPLGIYVFMRWSVSFNVLFIENTGALKSLGRSWQLTRGSWWHTCGVVVVGGIIIGVITAVLGGAFGFVAGIIGFALGSELATAVLIATAGAVASALVTPPSVAYLVILYYELRARVEGLDLQQRAQQATALA